MKTITKKVLVDQIAQRTGQKRVDTKQIVQEFLDMVIDEIAQGNRLEFRDFGVFEVKNRAPRIAQNPKTLERVPVPAKRTVKFKAGRRMRERLEAIPASTTSTTSTTPASTTPASTTPASTTPATATQTPEPTPQVHVNTGNAPAIIGSITQDTREKAITSS